MDNYFIFIIAMLFMFIAPIMAVINIVFHFIRVKVSVYEIICYILGIPLSVWVIFWYYSKLSFIMTCIFSSLPVVSYIYMKYKFDGSKFKMKAAKIISLICSVIFAAFVVYVLKYPIHKSIAEKDISTEFLPAFYVTLVPINYIITAVSEIIFQCMGKSVHNVK